MADSQTKGTSSKPTKQLSRKEIVAAVKKIIATKFDDRELIELRSWLNGVIKVAEK